MPTRTLGVALWEYRDQDGRRRRAYYRDTFDLPDSEVERGERAGVFALTEVSRFVGLSEEGEPSFESIDWPKPSDSKAVWLAFGTEFGFDETSAEGTTKPTLIAAIKEHVTTAVSEAQERAEHVAAQQDSSDQQP